MDIDLICFYEDKEDQEYYKQKTIHIEKGEPIDNDLRLRRVFQKEKVFKYLFRAIERNLKFVRNIYIISNSQLPEWLNTSHHKVKILSYKNIIPAHLLPTYNYSVIYNFVPYIADLSDNFLVVSENLLFAKELSEKDFFNEQGFPCIRFRRIYSCNNELEYKKYVDIKNAINVSKRYFDFAPRYFKHCQIEAFYKPDVLKCLDLIADETRKSDPRFASESDVSRYVWSYYAFSQKRAYIKNSFFYRAPNILKQILYKYIINLIKDNEEFDLSQQSYKLTRNIKMFSFNRDSKTTDNDEKRAAEFIENMFSKKSEFEI